MIIFSGNPAAVDEYETEIFITTTINGHLFDVPFTIYFDGFKVHIFHYKTPKYTIEKKNDVKYDKYIFRILIGSEIGISENYVKLPPDLFICFEKTSYPSKYFYRKAQMWIGAQISGRKVIGQIIYNNAVNRMLFYPKSENTDGVLFDGTTYLVVDDSIITAQ
ncbi:MAG: hypothetical protein ACP5KD_05090 [Fervidobacterium sp.]|jgi:hypothetical protein